MIRFLLLGALLAAAAPISTDASVEVPAEVQAQARREGGRFRAGRRCVPEAFAAIRSLRETYGVAGDVGKAAALAYRGCDDTLAYAELFEALFAQRGKDEDAFKLGAAWLRASRPDKAEVVLRPLAEADPTGRPAWMLGYVLFEQGRWLEARPWLDGAKETVSKAVRSDAPIMLALAVDDPAAAVARLRAAAEQRPEDPSLLAMLAYVQQRSGAEDDARVSSEQAKVLTRTRDAQRRTSLQTAALRASLENAVSHDGPAAVLVGRLRPRLEAGQLDALVETAAAALEKAGRADEAKRVRNAARR